MDVIRKKPDWKSRFSVLTGGGDSSGASGGTPSNLSNMDRVVAKKPLWKRLAIPAGVAVVVAGGAFWALSGPGGSVYRVPVDQLTIGTVTKGPFEDFIAVRGSVAPLIIDYLTTAQGGTVKQVLVEDGATVKNGQPLIVAVQPGPAAGSRGPAAHFRTDPLQISAGHIEHRSRDQPAQEQPDPRQDPAGRQCHRTQRL